MWLHPVPALCLLYLMGCGIMLLWQRFICSCAAPVKRILRSSFILVRVSAVIQGLCSHFLSNYPLTGFGPCLFDVLPVGLYCSVVVIAVLQVLKSLILFRPGDLNYKPHTARQSISCGPPLDIKLYYTAPQNVAKSSIDLHGPPQRLPNSILT